MGLKFRTRVAVLIAALASMPSAANACEITRLLAGSTEVAEVANHWDGDTYKTYLVRHNERDAQGVLNNWIRFELIPQRWGFDLELPSGKRFAQVNKEEGKWVVSASPGFMDACADSYVTLRKASATRMGVYDGLTLIGVIDRFPFNELF